MSDNPAVQPGPIGSGNPTCPNCHQPVSSTATFCPHCGSQIIATSPSPVGLVTAIPPAYGPSVPEMKHRSQRNLAIAIVLIALAISGIGGFFIYNYVMTNRNAVQAVATANEKAAASSAVDSMTITCASNSYDTSGYLGSYSFTSTFGVNNPSNYPMDTTWTFSLNYPNAGVTLSSAQTFTTAAHATAYPKFKFTLTSSDVNAIAADTTHAFKLSIDRTFNVQGSYGTYVVARHDTFDSTTGASTGSGGSFGSSGGSSSGLSSCPA